MSGTTININIGGNAGSAELDKALAAAGSKAMDVTEILNGIQRR